MIALLCLALAHAGSVYVNGVRADVLPEVTLKNVTVRVDAQGNLWIDAPQYEVQAVAAESNPQAATVGTDTTVPAGTWWLVTEDHQSTGQLLNVVVNGASVYRVSSGQGQILLDLGPYLRRGANEIRIEPVANGALGGGAFDVYVGQGANDAGTLRIDHAVVHYVRSVSDPVGSRSYQVYVP